MSTSPFQWDEDIWFSLVNGSFEPSDGLWRAQEVAYDAIVLDLMLPGVDGVTVCRRWRENGVWAPVLMLTARDAEVDEFEE